MLKNFSILLLFGFCIIGSLGLISVDPSTSSFRDSSNRFRIFHGVNVVYKTAPFYPDTAKFDPRLSFSQEDVDLLYSWGLNSIRLFAAWQGLEPQRGQYDDDYLNKLQTIVDMAGRRDILTILDMHQDVFNRKFCGEGAPDWATDPQDALPWPFPLFYNFNFDQSGYPDLSQCLSHAFFQYYFTEGASKSFQSLYDNKNGLLDSFSRFWGRVAKHFSDNPYVLGYELINEPWPGDIYKNPSLLVNFQLADRVNLQPMYDRIAAEIHSVDQDHIIFYEPSVANFMSVGFTDSPGGPSYHNRSALSFHVYCADVNSTGDPRSHLICGAQDDILFLERANDVKRLGNAGFLTEFGALSDDASGTKEAEFVTGAADAFFFSWTYWQYKFYNDFTTAANPPTTESLFNADGTVEMNKLKALSRTYAYAIAGLPTSMHFDPASAAFSLSFNVDKSITEPTEVYLNEDLHYPTGFDVSVSPAGALNWVRAEKNRLHFTPGSIANGASIAIGIVRK